MLILSCSPLVTADDLLHSSPVCCFWMSYSSTRPGQAEPRL